MTAPAAPAAGYDDGPVVLALLLAALAGWVDAAGLFGPGAVFVSFMSGNTTQGALAAAHHQWPRVAEIVAVIFCFVAGVTLGEMLDRPFGRYGRSVVLTTEALLLALAAWRLPLGLAGWGECCVLASAMGLQNATMHKAGGVNVGLTYITGTLVQLGRGMATLLGGGRDWRRVGRFVALWLCLAAGACGSGFAQLQSRPATLYAAACTAALLAAGCAMPGIRRRQRSAGV
ncbi:MAG TPA: YoaK family protein [Rhodopila sp.]|nr:YoaK family protein [Rhodopila sp.]